ncbi:unnamed protein product [Urochloa humidicola]
MKGRRRRGSLHRFSIHAAGQDSRRRLLESSSHPRAAVRPCSEKRSSAASPGAPAPPSPPGLGTRELVVARTGRGQPREAAPELVGVGAVSVAEGPRPCNGSGWSNGSS